MTETCPICSGSHAPQSLAPRDRAHLRASSPARTLILDERELLCAFRTDDEVRAAARRLIEVLRLVPAETTSEHQAGQ